MSVVRQLHGCQEHSIWNFTWCFVKLFCWSVHGELSRNRCWTNEILLYPWKNGNLMYLFEFIIMGAKNEWELQYKLNPCSQINLNEYLISCILSCSTILHVSCSKFKALILFCSLFIYLVFSLFCQLCTIMAMWCHYVLIIWNVVIINDVYFIFGTVKGIHF